MRFHDWTLFPALLTASVLIPATLATYGAARWILTKFDFPIGDQIAMASVSAIAFAISYATAARFMRDWINAEREGRLS